MFSSQENVWLDMTSIIQVRVLILSREVKYLFWVLLNSAKSPNGHAWDNYSQACHVTFIFSLTFDLLWLTLADNFCLKFDFSLHQLDLFTYSEWRKKIQKYAFTLFSDVDVKESCFLMQSLKFHIKNV